MPGETLGSAAAQRIHEDGDRSREWLHALPGGAHAPWIDREAQLVVASLHHAQGLALIDEVARDPHQHRGEAAGIPAQVDHDAVAVPELVDRFQAASRPRSSSR